MADADARSGRTCYDPTKAADAQVHRHGWCFAYAAGLGGVRIDPLGGRYAAQYDTDGQQCLHL